MLFACNKPSGISSFDVVKIIRTHVNDKVGHSGTLDPMASGLMVLGSGNDTKILTQLIGMDKSYITTIDFSLITDTRDAKFWDKEEKLNIVTQQEKFFLDIGGNLIAAPNLTEIKEKLNTLLYKENCPVFLPLPIFSAKKQNGKRLYKDARKGKAEIQDKEMKIYNYDILDYQFPYLKVKFSVGSGTYIRSIGYWLGKSLGLGGALTQLERISIGNIKLNDIDKSNFATGTIKGNSVIIYYKEINLLDIKINQK